MAAASTACRHAKTRIASVDGKRFAYRFVGDGDATPLVLLNHWGANLDNFDPAVVDPLATGRPVLLLNYRGIGALEGKVRTDAVGSLHNLWRPLAIQC